MEDNPETLQEFHQAESSNFFRGVVYFIAIAVYAGSILYAEVENWTLMTRGIPESMRLWAAVGVVGMGLTAIGLPLALHFWTHEQRHRMLAILFYVLDMLFLIVNVVLATAYNAEYVKELPPWLMVYRYYASPAMPMTVGVFWSILLLNDPVVRKKLIRASIVGSTEAMIGNKMIKAASSPNNTAMIQAAADREAYETIARITGHSTNSLPAQTVIEGKSRDAGEVVTRKLTVLERLLGKTKETINIAKPEAQNQTERVEEGVTINENGNHSDEKPNFTSRQ